MYCSHCGKEIPSNSQFCQYCGHRVNRGSSTELNKFSNLSSKQKKLVGIYGIWTLFQILFLAAGYTTREDYSRGLYLFNSSDLEDYDITDFLFYIIFLPLSIYSIYKIYKSGMKKKLKTAYIIGILYGVFIIINICVSI